MAVEPTRLVTVLREPAPATFPAVDLLPDRLAVRPEEPPAQLWPALPRPPASWY